MAGSEPRRPGARRAFRPLSGTALLLRAPRPFLQVFAGARQRHRPVPGNGPHRGSVRCVAPRARARQPRLVRRRSETGGRSHSGRHARRRSLSRRSPRVRAGDDGSGVWGAGVERWNRSRSDQASVVGPDSRRRHDADRLRLRPARGASPVAQAVDGDPAAATPADPALDRALAPRPCVGGPDLEGRRHAARARGRSQVTRRSGARGRIAPRRIAGDARRIGRHWSRSILTRELI